MFKRAQLSENSLNAIRIALINEKLKRTTYLNKDHVQFVEESFFAQERRFIRWQLDNQSNGVVADTYERKSTMFSLEEKDYEPKKSIQEQIKIIALTLALLWGQQLPLGLDKLLEDGQSQELYSCKERGMVN